MPDPSQTAAPVAAPQQPPVAPKPNATTAPNPFLPQNQPPKPTGPVPTQIQTHRDPATGKFMTAAEQAAADAATAKAVVGGQQPPTGGEIATPPAPEQPKIKIKVNGVEREIDLDTARSQLEIQEGYKSKFAELGQREQQLEGLVRNLQSDPATALEALGVDVESFAVQLLNSRVAMQQMSPQERAFAEQQQALAEREAAIQQYEQQVAMQEAEAQAARELQLLTQYAPQMAQKFKLPNDPNTLGAVAQLLDEAKAAGVGVTPETIHRAYEIHAQQEWQRAKTFIDNIPDEHLLEALGDRVRARFRKLELEQHRARVGQKQGPSVTYADPQPPKRKYITEAERLKILREQGG